MNITKRLLQGGAAWSALVVSVAALAGAPVRAQEAQPAAPQEASQELEVIPDIVVVATKRSESLQKVPMSITAFTADRLDSLGIVDSAQIAQFTPNLQWTSGTGYSRPSIYLRGLGNNSFHINAQGPVGVYTDGVFLGSMIAHPFQLFDLDRVEVLRGPQGTLYGRNTTAGLINFITKKAVVGRSAEGYVEATAGNYRRFGVEAAIGLPLGEKAAIRGAVQYDRLGGYFREINPSYIGKGLGRKDSLAGRLNLVIEPSSAFSISATLRGGRTNATPIPYKQVGLVYDAASPFTAPCPTANPALGQCTDALGFADSTNLYRSSAQFAGQENTRVIGGQVELNWTMSDALKLTSVTSYDYAKLNFFGDEDSSPFTQLHDGASGHSTFYSQELRLTSTFDGPFNFIAGAYYYGDKVASTEFFTLTDFGPGVISRTTLFGVPEGAGQFLDQKTRSAAAFTNVTYKVVDELTIRAGVRYTYDRRSAQVESLLYDSTGAQFVNFDRAGLDARRFFTLIPFTAKKKSWSRFSGNISIDYAVTPKVIVFVSRARGFKGGEFNGGALFRPQEATLVDPETVDSFEIGTKGTYFGGKLRINATAFVMNISDQQVFSLAAGATVPIQTLTNAGKSRNKGFEFEIEARPFSAVALNFSGGYNDAKFVRFQKDTTTNLAGKKLSYAPNWTLNGSVDFDLPTPFPSVLQISGSYVADRFFNVENQPFQRLDSYTTLDARYSFDINAVNVALWVKNFNKAKYYNSGSDVSAFGFYDIKPGAPRTYGLTARATF
jgi:iron complex outermembrane receptor protein